MSDASTKAGRIDAENQKVATVARPKPTLLSGNAGHAIVPQSVEACFRMADLIMKAQMAPKSFRTTEAVCVAIMQGLEVGLTPMAALQSIAVVNGMPTLWGDGFLALIENSGFLEEIDEDIQYDEKGEPIGATCTMKRVGRKPVTRMFTKPMAVRAGLLSKDGPWKQYPQRMYQMRARSWCGRDVFPDVLRGLGSAEERQDMVDITDQGSATTGEPEPTRAQFQTTTVETKGWELYDEVGEMIAEIPDGGEWGNRLYNMASKIESAARAQLLENNHATAKAIWEDDDTSQDVADGIKLIYTPGPLPEEQPQPKNWKVQPSEPGESAVIKGIMSLLDMDDADVPEILKQNAERIGKMGAMKRGDIERHAKARLAAIVAAQAA